jgi:ribonuclease HI
MVRKRKTLAGGFFDGILCPEGLGAGVLLVSPTQERFKYILHLAFQRGRYDSSTAECEGLVASLKIAMSLGISRLMVRSDSRQAISLAGRISASPLMRAYADEVRKLETRFGSLRLEHLPYEENYIAKELSEMAARRLPIPPDAFFRRVLKPSVVPEKESGKPATAAPGPSATARQDEAAAAPPSRRRHIM